MELEYRGWSWRIEVVVSGVLLGHRMHCYGFIYDGWSLVVLFR